MADSIVQLQYLNYPYPWHVPGALIFLFVGGTLCAFVGGDLGDQQRKKQEAARQEKLARQLEAELHFRLPPATRPLPERPPI